MLSNLIVSNMCHEDVLKPNRSAGETSPCNFHPSGWLRASALTCRLISLVGVKWSCLRINKAFPPSAQPALFRGSSRFESLILSHHSRFTCKCNKEDTNDDDDAQPARAAVKAAVERHLAGDSLMICDDLNYIKGFRCAPFQPKIDGIGCAALKERCPPRQKSRVERRKAKVEPLLT